MTRRGLLFAIVLGVAAAATAWLLFVGLPRWYGPPAAPPPSAPANSAAAADSRKIRAHLFYVSTDGTRLTSVEREVPYAEQTAAQARNIVEAQLAAVEPPLVSAMPAGTTLRALFVTPDGAAFVDLSADVSTAHPGGSISELLTIYTLVQALTVNLPAITSVQILVDGHEVDTLAGHVDIRRPLPRNDAWVSEPAAAAEAPAPAASTSDVPATSSTTPQPQGAAPAGTEPR